MNNPKLSKTLWGVAGRALTWLNTPLGGEQLLPYIRAQSESGVSTVRGDMEVRTHP